MSERLVLGVIVCFWSNKVPPFSEEVYFQQLTKVGKSLGINVVIFNPKQINWLSRTVPGWQVSNDGEWKVRTVKLPKLIYDRCYYFNSNHYLEYKPYLLKIHKDSSIRLLGRALSGKLQTYDILKKNMEILPHLPETIFYKSPNDVITFIEQKGDTIIKPNGGSHGRGVVSISKQKRIYLIKGRDLKNKIFETTLFSNNELAEWLRKFIGTNRFIIQPFLNLQTNDQRPFDLRILIQKNGHKEWEITGMAVRTGVPQTVTSNLHGGGNATTLHPFINLNYQPEVVRTITQDINKICDLVPPFIEENHGQLVELGLDVGIDRSGHVWILEVNSKPGRFVFIKTGDFATRKKAIHLPLSYALTLLTTREDEYGFSHL